MCKKGGALRDIFSLNVLTFELLISCLTADSLVLDILSLCFVISQCFASHRPYISI